MSFSLSTFTVEINAIPTIAFQAKWHAEAEEFGREWANLHWDKLSKDQHSPPRIIKFRLASAIERAAYEAADHGVDFDGEVMS